MSKENKLDSFEEKIQTAIKMKVPMPRQEFKKLLSKRLAEQSILKSRQKEGPSPIRLKPARAIIFSIALLIMVMTFAIGPKNIYAAIQNLLRYIPGIGFVETNRVLAEQVTVEREGINLTVQEMVVNEEETVLIYYVDNLPIEKLIDFVQKNYVDETISNDMSELVYKLRIENGDVIEGQMISGHTTNKQDGTDWTGKVVFPALPPNITEVQFLMNILPNMYEGMAPEDWVVSVSLKASDEVSEPSFVYQPSFTVVATEETETSQTGTATEVEEVLELKDDVNLLLNAVSITEDQITLSISVDWVKENWHGAEVIDFIGLRETLSGEGLPHTFSLKDANGIEVPLIYNDHETSGYDYFSRSRTFTFTGVISELELVNPLALELHGVSLTANLSDENIPTVEFTPTSVLLPGECEDISQSVMVYGSQVNFVKVCLVENPKSHGGGGSGVTPMPPPIYALEIFTEMSQNLFSIQIGDQNCLAGTEEQKDNCREGYGGRIDDGTYMNGTMYYEMPVFPIVYKVMGVDFVLQGPWAIEFDLP